MTLSLRLGPTVSDRATLLDDACAVAGSLQELTHMPRERRAECFARLAPEVFAITACCEGADEADLARRVVDEDGFARLLADALLSLARSTDSRPRA